ncbi:translation initiation factor if-2, putative [Perkinsus marinus ATCC 50983]|uniref:Eukaryotic translation initiation factor 5B n=1 Tax=Perkinsus marinus (strain ATCC 50983 / TXsc) TaxID=423536 RepID=C5L2Q0_PERM5|nr:translation initiation factor if-2, putative [Perkinsus marinus ATCC 50983]EER08965.1 translation initiation factor if-2, putative [Perkinsus marinus ATCC 50983]|eukprot:XP_002777149.1 translation initiation factor if-2, putative [Perkinsus marinus ATCC 50983]
MSDEEKVSNLEESNVDAKTLANRKKREKKKAKAAAQKSDKEGGKKMSAAAKLAAARLEAAREAEEERKRLEEEAQRKVEEEERLAAEKARKAQEEKERKAAEKKARRERLRAEGKLLSKREKEQKAKADAYRQMLIESGAVAAVASDEGSGDKPKKQSDLYGKKKSHKHKKQPSRGEESVASSTPDDEDVDAWEKKAEDVTDADKKSESAESVDDWELLDEDSDDEKVEAYPAHIKNKPQKKQEEEVDVKGKFAAADPLAVFDSSASEFRSPICCIMGHVDTGKTKLLDKIRRTTVQEGEAGGITQQIGATFFPEASLQDAVHKVNLTSRGANVDLKLPGLLIIDTPGHESFNNLRVRGSSLCDIAILVIDIMHGLEPQTIESLELLRNRKCPFIIALNKIDRLYQWRSSANRPSRDSLKAQKDYVKHEFDDRLKRIQLQLSERGLNTAVYWENHDIRRDVSIVPTSAVTGEGVPDLLYLIVKLTQTLMAKKITKQPSYSSIKDTDQICVCTLAGPVITTIRALLTPPPAKEIRVKSEYVHHKVINGSMGVKICAPGLEEAVAGTQLIVMRPGDDAEEVKRRAMADYKAVVNEFKKAPEGVYVKASTLGSLEALLDFLKTSSIPVNQVGIGEVHLMDVRKASIMLEKKKEYAVILAFDVKVSPEARDEAEKLGVKIMTAEIIYHLFDQFTAYMNQIKEEKRQQVQEDAVFPVVLNIIPQYVFNKKDPIVVGVDISEGTLRLNTPLCVPDKEFLEIGRVASIEKDHRPVEKAIKGDSVAIKIQPTSAQAHVTYGRHFDSTNALMSRINRRTIDCLKENFREDMRKEDWQLIMRMKPIFGIQ